MTLVRIYEHILLLTSLLGALSSEAFTDCEKSIYESVFQVLATNIFGHQALTWPMRVTSSGWRMVDQ